MISAANLSAIDLPPRLRAKIIKFFIEIDSLRSFDYYYDAEYKELQKKWFKRQIELANELKLPIIIHDRDAHGDTFEIIKSTKSPEIGCVLHCYRGSSQHHHGGKYICECFL